MRITEIEKVAPQLNPGIDYRKLPPLTPWKKAKVVDMILYHADLGDTQHVFAIRVEEQIIASIICRDYPVVDGKAVLQILRTWVDPKYRNKGYATAMYNTLYNQGYSLMSDTQLADGSLEIWKRFTIQRPVLQLDIDTHQLSELTPEVLVDPNLVYFMESSPSKNGDPTPRFRNRDNYFLTENNIFLGTNAP